ncbi:hypothetical protein BKI52_20520 [marine bacterium AO1-C]|nr:hypothetical protein BKI52_20520 [marine bacterium AO1-C]
MRFIKYIWLVGLLAHFQVTQAQTDPQFSQFYNVPLYQNPASVGTAGTRLNVTSRAQWAEIASGMNNTIVSLDHRFGKGGSNVGGFILRDQQGNNDLITYHFALQYGYALKLNKTWRLRAAMEVGIINKRLENNLKFVDQFTNAGLVNPASNERLVNESILYPSIGAGFLLHNDRLWLGAAVSHLNRPQQTFFESADLNTKVPMRATIYAGMRIPILNDPQSAISPTILYKQQGTFQQMDVGVYAQFPISYDFNYKHRSASNLRAIAGLVYRGWVFEKFAHDLPNNDAVILILGLGIRNLGISYSFDAGINGADVRLNNAHEISLVYHWQKKRKRKQTFFPCPGH